MSRRTLKSGRFTLTVFTVPSVRRCGMSRVLQYIELPNAEMYGEQFDVPEPDELLFISWFEGGEVFRSGAVWHRGRGRIFYFRPGHESYPIYYNQEILKVIANGVRWAKFKGNTATTGIIQCPNITEPLEPIADKGFEFPQIRHPGSS
ncbi:MAG: ThuA domain-containing protein [Pseudomonadales bacterium]